jgi:hypothetical protein
MKFLILINSKKVSDPGTKYHHNLAEYFKIKSLFLDEPNKEKPNRRKLIEQPWQQTEAAICEIKTDIWDSVIETLCDLYFIEAKCVGGLIFMLIDDYHFALDNIPERQVEMAEAKRQIERTDRWIREITEYSRKWSELHNMLDIKVEENRDKPYMPEFPPSCKMWSQEDIEQECQRIMDNPSRLDRLTAFEIFITSQCYVIIKYLQFPGFLAQHAYNCEVAGPVHEAAVGKFAEALVG